ncbi:MAG: discoidin domain-containing protein, partial [Clostridia bacterium]|nr:discoidin domain-containing protein [Clostridia bacterium]
IGDCYIAAGAAFANPGRNGVVCPPSWLAEALNYNKFVNGGCWGTMHEYNHCWQGYGFGNGGEVTNNATTLVAYSLYTRISQSRTAAPGWNNGSWNRFTDPSKSLGELLTTSGKGGKSFDLAVYASLLHNIGQDNFIAAARGGREVQSGVYYNNLVNATHYDMTYFVTQVLNYNVAETGAKGTLPQATVNAVKEKNYPMFVPVASVYQVGRSIEYDGTKQDIVTAQPFSYGTGAFTMDFNNKNNFAGGKFNSKALVIPDGFTVTVKGVTQPQNGKVELLENNRVKYTPKVGKDGLYSGNFKVTLGIVKDDGAFTVNDVDLIINLKQSTSTTLSRTTYVYENEASVPETNAIYNAETKVFDFGNYSSTECKKNVCTQETNTQIWAAGRNYDDDTYNKDSTNYRLMPVNKTVQMLDGVMYFSGAGTYRFTLKGRGKATLYLSYDGGETWENALTIARSSGNAYIDNEYSEHEFTTKSNYVYFRVVLTVTQENDFFGIGVASKNADGTFAKFTNAENALTMETAEVDKAIKEEAAKKFTTEYRYKNEYTYSYTNEDKVYASGTTPISVSHDPWDENQPIANMFDGDANTYYHSKGGEANYITAEKPFELVVDFGSVRKVNRVTFNGYKNKAGNNGMVKTFKIYGSTDGENYSLVTEVTDSAANAKSMTFDFEAVSIRYYKLVVTDTDNHRYFAMNSIVFSYNVSFADGFMIAPNDSGVKYTGTWGSKNVLCNFGIIYTAGVGDYVEYTFTGTRAGFAAYQSADYGTVDVY